MLQHLLASKLVSEAARMVPLAYVLEWELLEFAMLARSRRDQKPVALASIMACTPGLLLALLNFWSGSREFGAFSVVAFMLAPWVLALAWVSSE